MTRAFIGVGSNIDAEKNIENSLRMLARLTRLMAVSTFYRTPAIGTAGRADFLNGVVQVDCALSAGELKHDVLKAVEQAHGRWREDDRNAPRTIDLDLILFGAEIIHQPGLEVPHPDLFTRPFVAVPLSELDGGMMVPGTSQTVADIVKGQAPVRMMALQDFSRKLKEDFLHEFRKS